MGEYYREWAVSPIPALDGVTPKAALANEDLRPKLVELLKDMISMEINSPVSHLHIMFDVLGIRPEDLGLKGGVKRLTPAGGRGDRPPLLILADEPLVSNYWDPSSFNNICVAYKL